MKVVLIGSGGREHALAHKIAQSKKLEKLYIIPGNPGTKKLGENIDIKMEDHISIINFCKSKNIDLVVVGPEQPLVDGLTDKLTAEGIKVFGPNKEAARIEGEKSFAKEIMVEGNVPTASYQKFYKNELEKALLFLKDQKFPIVVKADGLAAGKGVIIANDFDEAEDAVELCFVSSAFGKSGDSLIIEEYMTGQEASVFAITDGTDFILLPAAQDHKRIGDGDTGKNTGGMGAYAPTPFVNDEIMKAVGEKIVEPVLKTFQKRNTKYSGCLYCGLMLTDEGPKVVEFNCRFGDPETQVVLPLLKGDLLELLHSSADGSLNKNAVEYGGGASVCVVAASGGYPDSYEKGKMITGLDDITDEKVIVYHAGTVEKDGKIYTSGGRVLGITSIIERNDLSSAKQKAYEVLPKINFDKMNYRKDISDKAIKIGN